MKSLLSLIITLAVMISVVGSAVALLYLSKTSEFSRKEKSLPPAAATPAFQ